MNISYFYTLRNNMYLIFFKYLNTHFYLCYQYYSNQLYLSIFFLFWFTKYGTCTFYSINVLSYNVVYIYFKIQDALYEYNVIKFICMICPTLIFCTVFIKCKEYCSIRLVSFLYASFMIFRGLLNRLKINNFSKATIRSSLDNYHMVHIYYFGKLRV